MHEKYYDTHDETVKAWQEQSAPSVIHPYGLGLDSDAYLAGLGVYPFREVRLDHDPAKQELVADATPVIEGVEAVLYYRPVSLPAETVTANYAEAVRDERDRRIAATDYLMAADYPLSPSDSAAVKSYRQALRDIPAQQGFPWMGPDDPACPWPETNRV